MGHLLIGDSLAFLKSHPEFRNDIIFADPPYALGSELRVRPDGKVDYAKASDFMGKWEMPTGEWWESWFREAFRSLKHGGYCVLYGMDRQTLLFKYYAALAGFQERQSLYWYFISSFPKAANLPKALDKSFGENVRVGKRFNFKGDDGRVVSLKEASVGYKEHQPQNALAKKYDGYKYSCAPLKQTCETVMVFQKPYLTGSCLHDVLALEGGDKTVACGALDIKRDRVPAGDEQKKLEDNRKSIRTVRAGEVAKGFGMKPEGLINSEQGDGRYPSQTFVDSGAAARLDEQSGVKKSGAKKKTHAVGKTGEDGFKPHHGIYGKYKARPFLVEASEGGCSKILHKCDFEEGEHDLYQYHPKVSGRERQSGLDIKNDHACLKPISLNERILRLFKSPNPQRICYPFAGSGSEIIGGHKAGFTDWLACELNPEYVEIAKARIKHWTGTEPEVSRLPDVELVAAPPTADIEPSPAASPPTPTETPAERYRRLCEKELEGTLDADEIHFLKTYKP